MGKNIKYMMCVRKNFTYVMKLALYNNRFALKIYSIINALTYFLIYSNDNSYERTLQKECTITGDKRVH